MLDRDLRESALWAEVEAFYRSGLAGCWGRPYAVEEPALSPDGTRVAYVGEGLNDLDGRPWKVVYVIDLATGQVQTVSAPGGSARAPAWAASGAWLAYLIRIEDRDALRFWEVDDERTVDGFVPDDGVDRFVWAHDRDVVLAWAAQSRTELGTVPRRPDAPWMPTFRSTLDSSPQVVVTQTPGGAATPWPVPPDRWVWEAGWTGPDAVVAITSDRAEPSNWYRSEIALIDGGVADVLHRPVRQLGALRVSPDERNVSWIEGLASDRGMVAGGAAVMDLSTRQIHRIQPATWDITDLRWRNAAVLTYLGIDDLETVGGEIPTGELVPRETWRSAGTCGMPMPSGSPAGEGRILVAHEDWQHPPVLAMVGTDGSGPLETGEDPAGVVWARAKKGSMSTVRWATPDGWDLSGLLVVPSGDPPFPLVVNVHGGPVWAWRNSWDIVFHTPVSLLVSRGFAVLQPNGRGSVGRGRGLTEAILGAMGGTDLQDYTSAATALVESGVADREGLSVVGHSYGGLVACALATSTDLFAAAVALSPATDWVSQHYVSAIPGFDELFSGPPGPAAWATSPIAKAGDASTPTLIVGGEADDCCPVGQAIEFYRALAEHGRTPAALAVYPDEGHGLRGWPARLDQSVRIVEWLERYAGGRVNP